MANLLNLNSALNLKSLNDSVYTHTMHIHHILYYGTSKIIPKCTSLELYISQTTKDAMRSVTMAACGAYTVIYRLREGHSALVDIGFPILLVSIYIVNRRLYY